MSPVDTRFIRALRKVKPCAITDPERLAVYESDGLTAVRQRPAVVVIPDTVEEVQAVVRLCHTHRVPLVARGAGTGLSGGAMPHSEGVLMVMSRFNRIRSVDAHGLTAVVEPGVTNLAISQAVEHLDLYYAPDPSSQLACTLGGNVAENSGGVHCLKYGLTVHNVFALKIVLPDGELVTLGGKSWDTPGLDLLALMHGSEGMLGIIVEVVVRLLPKPDSVTLLLAAFDSVRPAADSVGAIIGRGILPAGLEMMDGPAIRAAEAFVKAGYPVDAGAILLIELDGAEVEVAAALEKTDEVLRAHGVKRVVTATSAEEKRRLWAGRKAAFPAVGRIAPDYYCMDGTIPRRELAATLTAISELSARYRLEVANVFHAGDGNLHPLILFDANDEKQLAAALSFGSDILRLCIEKGGTITGEHGVGVEKINEMCVQFTESELTLFHRVKEAFDGHRILNPGKAVPTLSRCAEFGAMHVHRGNEKFPNLERF